MKKSDLYATPANQHRLVIGKTPVGDIAFATRGGNTNIDYNQCQIQPSATFENEGKFVETVSEAEIDRVTAKFASYIVAKNIS